MCPSVCPAPCPCTGSSNQQRVADGRSRPAADGAGPCPESPPDPSRSPGSCPTTSSTPAQSSPSSVRPALPRLAPPANVEDFGPDLTLRHFGTTQPPITIPQGKVPIPGRCPGSQLGYLELEAEHRPTHGGLQHPRGLGRWGASLGGNESAQRAASEQPGGSSAKNAQRRRTPTSPWAVLARAEPAGWGAVSPLHGATSEC